LLDHGHEVSSLLTILLVDFLRALIGLPHHLASHRGRLVGGGLRVVGLGDHVAREQLLLSLVEVRQDVGVGYWLREREVNGVVIILKFVLELQRIIVEHFAFFRLLLRWLPSLSLAEGLVLRAVHVYHRDLRPGLGCPRTSCGRRWLVEGLFDPVFLVRISTCGDDIFFAAGYVSFHILACFIFIGYTLPVFEVFALDLFLL